MSGIIGLLSVLVCSQGVASKEDIGELRAEMKAETADLRTGIEALRAEVEKLRADMTWRMVLIMGAMLGLFTALDRLFLI